MRKRVLAALTAAAVLLGAGTVPAAAKGLKLIDNNADVLKTFNDYKEESSITMMRMFVPAGHPWENMPLSEVTLPTGEESGCKLAE